MLAPSPLSSRLSLVLVAACGMLLSGCQKSEHKASTQETPGALSMKLNDPQAALDFLEKSDLRLRDAKDDCALLAEDHATLGALVHHARQKANTRSIQCEASPGSKTWSCKADFMNSGGEQSEATDFRLNVSFNVDDTSRTIPPESLVCLMAG